MQPNLKKRYEKNIAHILSNCANIKKKDKLLILYDKNSKALANCFLKNRNNISKISKKFEVKNLKNHGQELDQKTSNEMKNFSLILSICQYSLAHTKARINASKINSRFLSLPGYNFKMINDDSLKINFKKYFKETKRITNKFSNGKKIKIFSDNGTNIELDISKRNGNCCPGFVLKKGDLGSPPDIETNISPNEKKSNGRLVIDGSITHPTLGKLKKKDEVVFIIKNGLIKSFECKNDIIKNKIKKLFFTKVSSKRRVLAECGIGLNPKAKLSGNMLTDEGSRGLVHLGFGSNFTVGGENKINFHIDCVIKKPTLYIDKNKIVSNGKICKI